MIIKDIRSIIFQTKARLSKINGDLILGGSDDSLRKITALMPFQNNSVTEPELIARQIQQMITTMARIDPDAAMKFLQEAPKDSAEYQAMSVVVAGIIQIQQLPE